MACHAGHGDVAIPPRWAKIKVKGIILDKLKASVVLWLMLVFSFLHIRTCPQLTVWNLPPDRWPATALEMDGFSATQRILVMLDLADLSEDCVPEAMELV